MTFIRDAIFALLNLKALKNAIEDEDWRKQWNKQLISLRKMHSGSWSWKEKEKEKRWLWWSGSIGWKTILIVGFEYLQQGWLQFHETFAQVVCLDTIKAIIVVAPKKGWLLYQLNIKSTFWMESWMKKFILSNLKTLLLLVKERRFTSWRRPCTIWNKFFMSSTIKLIATSPKTTSIEARVNLATLCFKSKGSSKIHTYCCSFCCWFDF